MAVGRDQVLDQLEVMTETDEMRSAVGMVQKTVVKTFPITYPVPGQIKSDARDNDQISFICLVIDTGRARFQDAECTLL